MCIVEYLKFVVALSLAHFTVQRNLLPSFVVSGGNYVNSQVSQPNRVSTLNSDLTFKSHTTEYSVGASSIYLNTVEKH